MKKFLPLLIFFFLCIGIYPAHALYGNFDQYIQEEANEEIYYQTVTIPKGSIFRGFLGQTVSSEFNNNGDIIKILIPSDFTYDNQIIIPKNTLFLGQVHNLEKAQQGRDGFFSIKIIGITFPDNREYTLNGYVAGTKNSRVFGGEFSKRSGHKTTLHRSYPFRTKGVLYLQQNGPRVMGKETILKMGEFVTIVIEEETNIE